MIRVFILLLSTIAGVWYVAYTLETKGPGYVWISYNNYSIETTFWIFAAMLAAVVASAYCGLFLLKIAIKSLKHMGWLSKNWGLSKSELQVSQFRMAYADQQWGKADEIFSKRIKMSLLTPPDKIMSVRTAVHLENFSDAAQRLAELKAAGNINEFSLRMLELDVALAGSNSGLALTLYSQLVRDYPKENHLMANALHYFLAQGAVGKATDVYNAMSRKQKKQSKQKIASLEQVKVNNASNADEIKSQLKSIHKQPPETQVALLIKAQGFNNALASKALLQALKHKQYSGLAALSSWSLNEAEALTLINLISGVLDDNKADLSAPMLAGLAQLTDCAKLHNKSLELFEKSLLLEHSPAVFASYVLLLKTHKSADEMNAAIIRISKAHAC
ncbi:MAG: hypothetical protein KAG18_05665 [Sinobacterium sp.]|nr:hypothetical protein [Sinobacterium sp.]